MSKREIQRKKLDTKMLWGIGITTTAIAGALWILNRHKNKKQSERAAEIDHRDDVRIKMLDERLIELNLKLQYEEDVEVRKVIEELRQQAVREKQRITASRTLSPEVRLLMEACDEAAANIDHELDVREERQSTEKSDDD